MAKEIKEAVLTELMGLGPEEAMRGDFQVPGCTELPEAENGGEEVGDDVVCPSFSPVGTVALITNERREGMAVTSCRDCWAGFLPSAPESQPDLPEG